MATRYIKCLVVPLLLSFANFSFAIYEPTTDKGVTWLTLQQNADGSWGELQAEKSIQTLEVVSALSMLAKHSNHYYRGITWLQNHAADNIDFKSKRAIELSHYGNNIRDEFINGVEANQQITNAVKQGWGLTSHYIQSPLDTVLVLTALKKLDYTGAAVNQAAAINYLKQAVLAGNGWSLNNTAVFDPYTTSYVLMSLAHHKQHDPTLTPIIAQALNRLKTTININKPIELQILAALAAITNNDRVTAGIWIPTIHNAQKDNGSWDNNPYTTALALKVFAALNDVNQQHMIVDIPDANLRRMINNSLGRNAMDKVSRRELALLTKLDIQNSGVTHLTGLEWAINLVSLDLRGNTIHSTEPLANLVKLKDLKTGDVDYINVDEDIPFMPLWALALMCLSIIKIARPKKES